MLYTKCELKSILRVYSGRVTINLNIYYIIQIDIKQHEKRIIAVKKHVLFNKKGQ